ncbi:ABC transporter ATP-binding protein [Nocardioides carbamazepini]|nr:ABC transporter ATP-binding protein [Nocardioides carbamazepini]
MAADHVAFSYSSAAGAHPVLGDISFTIARGEFVSLVGPSGIGKTTLLRVLSGLMQPTAGEVRLDGERVTEPPRQLALVLQDYSRSLLPWMSIERNVALPLRSAKVARTEVRSRTAAALDAVGLAGDSEKYPWQLSGGMQQRVAIARALAYQPEVLVMDEPFASVDAQTRFDLEDLVLRLRREFGMTVLLVTHDIDEAVYLSDRIVVLAGKPAQVADCLDVPLGPIRDQIATKALPEYAALRGRVLSEIRAASAARTDKKVG